MLSLEKSFETFDKNKKNYLTKHELKLTIIYLFGAKINCVELKNFFNDRMKYLRSMGTQIS